MSLFAFFFLLIQVFMSFFCETTTPSLLLEIRTQRRFFTHFLFREAVLSVVVKKGVILVVFFYRPQFSLFFSHFFTVNSITCELQIVNTKYGAAIMPARRMRVEVFDGEGNKYTVALEGQISREKALRLLEMVELLGGVPSGGGNPEPGQAVPISDFSKYEKMQVTLRKHFPIVWFSSREVQPVYEQEFKEPISLSTVATYLSRMTEKGFLMKVGSSRSLKYKLAAGSSQATVKQQIL
jgi:hypothetical protein